MNRTRYLSIMEFTTYKKMLPNKKYVLQFTKKQWWWFIIIINVRLPQAVKDFLRIRSNPSFKYQTCVLPSQCKKAKSPPFKCVSHVFQKIMTKIWVTINKVWHIYTYVIKHIRIVLAYKLLSHTSLKLSSKFLYVFQFVPNCKSNYTKRLGIGSYFTKYPGFGNLHIYLFQIMIELK